MVRSDEAWITTPLYNVQAHLEAANQQHSIQNKLYRISSKQLTRIGFDLLRRLLQGKVVTRISHPNPVGLTSITHGSSSYRLDVCTNFELKLWF